MNETEDYRIAYFYLSSKVSEIVEYLRKPLEGETRGQIRNSAASRMAEATALLERARGRAQQILTADETPTDTASRADTGAGSIPDKN